MTSKKFVTFLKYLLPAICIILVGVVFFCSSKHSFAPVVLSDPEAINTAKQLKYCGEDTKGRPFTIISIKGKEISDKEILLHNLEVRLSLTEQGHIKLRADQGIYNKPAKTIRLSGNVSLIHTNGLEINTSEATINFAEGTAENNVPVEGHNEKATIKATGFKVLENGQKIVFLGQPQLIMKSSIKGKR